MRKRLKYVLPMLMLLCMLFGTCHVFAADELLGTVVDGSLLTDGTEAEYTITPKARGAFLSYGTGSLTQTGTRQLYMSGTTVAYQAVDKIKVTLHLQRLVNGTWVNVATLDTKTAYNDYYVSNSRYYSVSGGYYYRVYGGHSIIESGTSEALTSYSNGFWVD